MSDWRKTTEYRHWRAQVLWRDRACVICNSKASPNAHHVNSASYYKELRFDVDNGVCLCSACHQNLHCNFHRSYRTKCDEYNFMNFVKLSTHFHGIWNATACSDNIPMEEADVLVPNLSKLSAFTADQTLAFIMAPDSVVGYVTELATLRNP